MEMNFYVSFGYHRTKFGKNINCTNPETSYSIELFLRRQQAHGNELFAPAFVSGPGILVSLTCAPSIVAALDRYAIALPGG